jgi:hypothetical protein
MKKIALLSAALALAPVAAFADAHSEIVLAQQHAGLAAASQDIAGVHMHLHHTLNCLVGPGGPGFDAKEMNPCANAGHGAIPDNGITKELALKAAADAARAGLAEPDLVKAQVDAQKTADMLKGDE